MRPLLVACVAAAALAVSGISSATLRSGLYGHVTRGPITPVCYAEQPCTAPAANAVIVFSQGQRQVARVITSSTGTYRIHLAPGLYALRGGKSIDPATIRVRSGRKVRVDLSIDTGIR